jgi:Acetyltransferase (GNAT) domain
MMEEYDELVASSPEGSVFAASWWLDAVAPGRWRANAVDVAGSLVAAWPTVVRPSRFGTIHEGAPLTPFLGPLFRASETPARRYANEIERLELVLERLGRLAHLDAHCNPAFEYWTPLSWHGFEQTTHYTWRLTDLGDLERVWAGLRENARREVRKARKREIEVVEGSLDELERVQAQTAERQDRTEDAREKRAVLRRIDEAAAPRGARSILIARDPDGRPHAGGYFVWDGRYTYYLLGGTDTELRTSGAPSLLMWAAIEQAAARGTAFDFEGSMLRHVERFFRSFGGTPVPYSIVRWTPSRALQAAVAVKRGVTSVVGRGARLASLRR